MEINWKQKLTSRKFWAAVIGVVAAIGVLFGIDDLQTEHVTALISACSVLIAYIIGEGLVDAKNAGSGTDSSSEGDSE